MGGGLMQLVAYGAQDIYLTGNPQITFFKVVYRRHTNFSMEAIEQTINGTISTSAASSGTVTISRNGDLVHRLYVETTAPVLEADADDDNYGYKIFDSVELEIGGQKIDKHFGHWMEVWSELTEKNPEGLFATVSTGMGTAGTLFQRMACAGGTNAAAAIPGKLFIPLQFWFCRNPGLALPLIALQYHEVKVKLNMSARNQADISLWADYIYLDTDERRRFAQVSHEYLIEQVQHQQNSATSHELNFNHPVKELIWTPEYVTTSGTETYTTTNFLGKYQLKLNGHDRFAARDSKYFTRSQVWQHHTGFGGVTVYDSIAVYSFALKPEEHQPSGTCNFSRIDNAQLVQDATSGAGGSGTAVTKEVYAVNYNVLRIMSGMGGLAYSN
jgi:hypothetical protein